jgi:hypothetical protein
MEKKEDTIKVYVRRKSETQIVRHTRRIKLEKLRESEIE